MPVFTKKIRPYVEQELDQYRALMREAKPAEAFKHLENAHVLGQESTWLHVKVHWIMMLWGFQQKRPGEFFGQIFRIFGAAAMTAIGFVPKGNTGGSNVSPFKVMPIRQEHERLIEQAKAS
ncbi:DUF3703 domain-containing protein [Endozoicomonas numazuensis]|uniref:DUF3703 domain-containing protein n=1 Tax=Endozoicomonas numazuensis TaxID=1137799 RepID=A0A081NF86_9GAMM|nr:DUF3703 domain-containing protein [Endozoicomonas numazuensis]KEQ17109.1 hypothetical protein GZ78_14640 [Endozoicomonas numazuensis]